MKSPLLCFIGIATLAACDGRDSNTALEDAEGTVFHRGNFSEPDTLAPHRSEETGSHTILRDLFEGLVTEDVDANIVPGAAKSWTISDDATLYTFLLRDNARWSNGDPVTSADFVAGLRRTVDPATASTYAQVLYPVANAEAITRGELPPESLGIRAIDERTIEIRLNAPTGYFLQLLTQASTYPLHRASYAQHGDRFARPGNLISNGAFQLTEWIVNSHIRAVKNEFYSGAAEVGIDVVYYHSTEDLDGELRRYRAGELDYTYQIPNSQFDWISANLPGELHVKPYLSVYFYGFDVTEPPFDDVRLRQALSMAVDRRVITEQVTGIGELPAYGIVPPGTAGYESQNYDWQHLTDGERIAEAKRLYTAAGYSEQNPLRTEIRYNTSEDHARIAVAVASMWKQALGVETSIVNEEWKVLLQTRQNPSRWDVLRYGWNGDYNDAFTFLELFQSGHGQNFTGLANQGFDELAQAAAFEADTADRAEIMKEAERTLLNEYPVIPLYFYVSKHLVKPYVHGYRPNIMDHDMSRHYRVEQPRP